MDIAARVRLFALGVALAIAPVVPVPAAPQAATQAFAFGWNPRTGDAAMDARLADINQYGDRYRAAFVDELVRYHAAPRALVDALLADEHWAPGDVYYACALAQAVGRPCRHVLEVWREMHASGWGEVAARLGVPVDSPAFARIADGVAASYVRWGRPLPDTDRPVVDG
ncbi:MAG TPA: hypothetical protein VFM73_09945 [Xanthomonadaceae bacterium]|nr:hypothetical protein [Xanthomonadaceae bacterium]